MLQYLDTIIAFAVIMLGVSLLITILTQMISALLGCRGTNLLWGLKTLLGTVEPQLVDKADILAHKILEAPLISDSIFSKFKNVPLIGKLIQRWKLASAITTEELTRSLKTLADTMQTTDKPTALLIETMLSKPDPEATRKVQMIQTVLGNLNSNYAVQLDKAIQQLGATVQASIGKVEAGFDVVMKRVSQRFALQMRIWTIVFAVLISFVAGLDSFSLFQQLWINPGLRTDLAGQREMLLQEASIILPAEKGATPSATSSVAPIILTDALKKLKEEEKESTASLPEVTKFENMKDAVDWLRSNLKADRTRENLVNRYQVLVLEELRKHANTIQQGLAKSGFQPQAITSWTAFKSLSIWGMLITAAFLSLGAPFWFSTLKTLSNLRPLATSVTKATPGSTQS